MKNLNKPAVYINSSFQYEAGVLNGKWISLPNNNINQIINNLKTNDDDTIIILDHENIIFDVNLYDDIFHINNHIASISHAIHDVIDKIETTEENKKEMKQDIKHYLKDNDLLSDDLSEILFIIYNLDIWLENVTNINTPSLLFEIGFEDVNNNININDLPDIISDHIDYEAIGRNYLINDQNETLVGYQGDLNDHIDYVIFNNIVS